MPIPAWHERCTLRDDVRSGRLELFEFAADLNLVRQQKAPPIYQDPAAFFARTHPSGSLKLLVRQVMRRLSDLPDGKPVIRMQVSYGGGKTHTLIALLHLAEQGALLHQHPTVRSFLTFADLDHLPPARAVLLPFDKFGFQEGLTVYDPEGHSRTAYTPWGALAYQLGGDMGLSLVNDDPNAYIAPGEERLAELLAMPQRHDGRGTLILIDETLMYCRAAYNARPQTLGILKDFFQRLTQATGRTSKCALVASLVAAETEQYDAPGILILRELEAVFSRVEENIEPVGRDDLPEVLRRRFFEYVPPVEERQPIVDAIMAALQPLPVHDSQKSADAERRFRDAYPFHPELLDVLTQKWIQLQNFQRTRGSLRLLGLALQEAVDRDPSPLIGPSAFLTHRPGQSGASPAITELVKATDESNLWIPILEGEAARARDVQSQFPALRSHEIEQAVIATFLHSQPRGKRAETADLLGLLAYSGVDRISLEEGLKNWRGVSWFLVEGDDLFWQLDLTPNLNQMHATAMERVRYGEIEDEVRRRVKDSRVLTTSEDVPMNTLPLAPRDVPDKPEFRYLLLGPECAVTPGQPVSSEVSAFLTTTSGPTNLRTYKNALVALAPDTASLNGLRDQVRRWLAWKLVQQGRDAISLSEAQHKKLASEMQKLNSSLPNTVMAAWSVLVALDESGTIKAELLKTIPSNQNATPFERVVFALRESERLAPERIDPELLLPDSYLNLWRSDQTALSVETLVNSFGQFTRLPRLLRRSVLEESLKGGVLAGTFVLRLVRSDGSIRTIWRQSPSAEDLGRAELEIVPITHAALTSLDATSLVPGTLPGLWPTPPTNGLLLSQVSAYFDGQQAPKLDSAEILHQALRAAVKEGLVMVQVAGESYCRESLPPDLALGGAHVLPSPPALRGSELGQVALPAAWSQGSTTVGQLLEALNAKRGSPTPWPAMREALIDGDRQNVFSLDTNALLTAAPEVRTAILVRPREVTSLDTDAFIDASVSSILQGGAAKLSDIKAAIERARGVTIPDAVFERAARQAAAEGKITLPELPSSPPGTPLPNVIVQPKKTRLAVEAKLNLKALQHLPQAAEDIKNTFPEMNFEFQITISAEGETLTPEQMTKLNEILTTVSPHLRLG
jgi:hypothetical protein